MQTLLDALREIIGTADFYIENGSYNGTWDYGAITEYFVCALILLVVISSIFKCIVNAFK